MVQTHDYEGNQTHQKMSTEAQGLIRNMLDLRKSGSCVSVMIPIDLIDFVENARNPDIYTRQFVEEAMRLNQDLKGKAEAYAYFTEVLGKEMMSAIPDIKGEIGKMTVVASGRTKA